MSFHSVAQKKVKHLIHGKPHYTIAPDCTVQNAANLMKKKNISALSVMQEKQLSGVVCERDIVHDCLGSLDMDPMTTPVSRIMTTLPITVDKNMTLGITAVTMIENNIRHVPVTAGTKVLGLISIQQIVEEFKMGVESSIAGQLFVAA